jgi:hypothetical protein
MNIDINTPQTWLIFGGLFFILVGLVNLKINKGDSNIFIEANKGKEKYLVIFGFIVLIIGVMVSLTAMVTQSTTTTLSENNPSTTTMLAENAPSTTANSAENIPSTTAKLAENTPSTTAKLAENIPSANTISENAPSANITSIYVVHNYFDESTNTNGMLIHLSGKTDYLNNAPCKIVACFYNSNDGTAFRTYDENYSYEGIVATYTDFTPEYVHDNFVETILYLPYNEFGFITPGTYYLYFTVFIIDENKNKLLYRSEIQPFQYTQY